jgi:hypothetical protein
MILIVGNRALWYDSPLTMRDVGDELSLVVSTKIITIAVLESF